MILILLGIVVAVSGMAAATVLCLQPKGGTELRAVSLGEEPPPQSHSLKPDQADMEAANLAKDLRTTQEENRPWTLG